MHIVLEYKKLLKYMGLVIGSIPLRVDSFHGGIFIKYT
jgi:hypothetical protein